MSAASRPFRIFGVLVSSASVRAMSALAGVRWAFAHGGGGGGGEGLSSHQHQVSKPKDENTHRLRAGHCQSTFQHKPKD